MTSIVNGLFAGRSGLSSHGAAIAVIGDNISNSSTIGYKTARAEFEDLVSGGQATGRIVGSGSQISAVSSIFTQGTFESTGRQLDLGIAGNGFFVLNNSGSRFYSRAGNFKIDANGDIVNQNGLQVMGFPSGGSGALEALSINNVSQDSVATTEVAITGNLNAGASTAFPTSTSPAYASLAALNTATIKAGSSAADGAITYSILNEIAEFRSTVEVFDSLGEAHSVNLFFFKTETNQYTVQAYVNAEEVSNSASGSTGLPRLISTSSTGAGSPTTGMVLNFNSDGSLNTTTSTATLASSILWSNGSTPETTTVGATNAADINFDMSGFTQFSSASNATAITQDGKGVGTVGSISISKNGEIFAILSNGQSSVIGTIGLVNFSNPEGLTRIGGNLLQQSPDSGEPIVGRPDSGTFGTIESGRIELSTVDIADQFVKLITLQRGFQANSRIITTINQLLNDIIQLA